MTRPRPFGWLRPPRAVVLGLVILGLLAVVVWNLSIGFPKNPATVAEIEAEIREAIPPGSTRSQVESWLARRGFLYSTIPDDRDVALQSMLHDTDRSILITGSIQARFSFGEDGRLVGQSVGWIGTGP